MPDIVSRLRLMAGQVPGITYHDLPPASTLADAADEIERLRNINRHLEMLVAIEKDMQSPDDDDAVWVRPKPPKPVQTVIRVTLDEDRMRHLYGDDRQLWADAISFQVQRYLQSEREKWNRG